MEKLPDDKPNSPAANSSLLRRYAGMGIELAGAICGLTLAGYWFDRHYQTGRKATIIGVLIGVFGGMYNFIRQAMAMSRQAQRDYENAHDGRQDGDGPTPPTGA